MPFLHFGFITCSSHFLTAMYVAHLLTLIDAFAINCVGGEVALLCQLQIININKVSIYYHHNTLLHDETEIDSNISFQVVYWENEGSFSSDESDSLPVLQPPFQKINHATFRSFLKIARFLFSCRCNLRAEILLISNGWFQSISGFKILNFWSRSVKCNTTK